MSIEPPIRQARVSDVPLLGPLELRAAQRFAGSAHPYACSLAAFEPAALARAVQRQHVWVAVDQQDTPVGFAVAGWRGGEPYLHELDVEPEHGGRGIGRRLVRRVGEWARAVGGESLLLSTFADVPWNAPFYARLGFEIVPLAEYTAAMLRQREQDGAQGLRVESRVMMRARLGSLLAPTHA